MAVVFCFFETARLAISHPPEDLTRVSNILRDRLTPLYLPTIFFFVAPPSFFGFLRLPDFLEYIPEDADVSKLQGE